MRWGRDEISKRGLLNNAMRFYISRDSSTAGGVLYLRRATSAPVLSSVEDRGYLNNCRVLSWHDRAPQTNVLSVFLQIKIQNHSIITPLTHKFLV